MKNQINVLDANRFHLESRGNVMTLVFDAEFNWWEMHTDNASHRAYGGPGIRIFDDLKQVEKAYKSWKGISVLAEDLEPAATVH